MSDIRPILASPAERRRLIRDMAINRLTGVFPIETNNFRLNAKNVRVHEKDFSPADYKNAMLRAQTLAEPVSADLELQDKSGKVVGQIPNYTLLRLPHLTDHDSFVISGNPVSVSNQLRLRPGVYTRKRRDNTVESDFKVTHGNPFRLHMDPREGVFTMEYGSTRVPLYAALQALGVSDNKLRGYWNKDLLEANRTAAGNVDRQVKKLYRAAVPNYLKQEGEDEPSAIKTALGRVVLDPKVTAKTLGRPHESVTPDALLDATQRILKVYKDDVEYDERDSLAYKHLKSVEDFVGERIDLDARGLRRKIADRLNRSGKSPDLARAVPPAPFTKGLMNFLSTSSLAENPTQINPLEMLDHAVRVTSLGEGGIGNERAVPLETRRLHPTHLGVLDPIRTPESARSGIDLRMTIAAARDREGNIFVPVENRTGKLEYKSVYDLEDAPVAFPDQTWDSKRMDAMHQGRIQSMRPKDVRYRIPSPHSLYSPVSNLVPFLNSADGMRASMGAKFLTQALPLRDGEAPLVQVASDKPNESMEEIVGAMMSVRAPISGKVTKIEDGKIVLRPGSSKRGSALEKDAARDDRSLTYFQNMPLASKTYLDEKPRVAIGDEVKKGQVLAEGPYSRGGVTSLGKNLQVAYMPFRSLNTNDAVVISESAARKLTSTHMIRPGLDLDADTAADKGRHQAHFGNKYSKSNYGKLDKNGLIKPGARVDKGDILVAAVRKTNLSPEAAMLGKLHKSLVKPFRDASVTWDVDRPGEVVDVAKTGNKVRLTVKYDDPMEVGSKLSGRFGDKGVVAAILPDAQMPHNEKREPVDVVLSSTGIVSRVNPAQVLELATGKVAQKLGHPIRVDNFARRDNVKYVKKLLEDNAVSDTETMYDPETRKRIPGVLTGPRYIMKLMKTIDTQYSARGIDGYDIEEQPSAHGKEGSKGFGRMEINALLGHNARNILKDAAALKSQKNDEYWRAYQLGLPPPALKTPFSYDKFGAMLRSAGIRMDKSGDRVSLSPLTDDEILKESAGEIKNGKFVRARDLRPEQGGLFDPAITGGPQGKKWGHVSLAEPVLNPVFERPTRTFLGMTGPQLAKLHREEGGAGIKQRLNKIDLAAREKEVKAKIEKVAPHRRDDLVKQLKYIRALNKADKKPGDAYVLSHLPVLPPAYRPIVPGKGDLLLASGSNYLYQDAILANDLLRKSKDAPNEIKSEARDNLFQTTSALFGLRDSTNPRNASRNVQGFLARIAGTVPKAGYFHSRVIRKQQDLSGRGAVIPDPTLGMDEVGIPEDMGWKMYSPFLVRSLVTRGYGAVEAKKLVEEKSPVARDILMSESKSRPVLVNRAPTLHRYNVLAAYPRFIPGKAVRVPEMFAPLQNMDFDGDTVQVHVPVSTQGVSEAKKMTLSNNILGDRAKNTLLVKPDQEAVLGLYLATEKAEGKKRKFKSLGDARAAYNRGEITLQTPIEIENKR